jgi:pyridoxal phosphate enzyme (YggS family)
MRPGERPRGAAGGEDARPAAPQGLAETVAGRVGVVRRRVAAAAGRARRDPGDVTIVAVAKLQPPAAVRAALAAGVRDIGENYAQELAAKAAAAPGARWHMVGRLQRNKAAAVVAVGALVHSLDSLPLARALGGRARRAGTVAEALVQVEVDGRPAAHGVPACELDGFVRACRGIEGLRLRGLMVMPAPAPDPEASRAAFAAVAQLARNLGREMQDLSMGMTADLEVAVEEGATLVRVGTAIFGPRPDAGAPVGGGASLAARAGGEVGERRWPAG